MSYFRNFLILALFFIPIHSFSDEKIEQSKYFVENLGKQVIEKVSNVNLSESERVVNFRNLYLDSFDNYYISRFVLGRYWKRLDSNMRKQFVESLDEELKKLSDLIDWAHSNKLEFHITELDYYNDGENNIFNSVKKQAEVYQKLMNLLKEKSKNGLVTVNFWSMGERISSRGKKGHYMSIYNNDTIPTKTYEVVKKFINFN